MFKFGRSKDKSKSDDKKKERKDSKKEKKLKDSVYAVDDADGEKDSRYTPLHYPPSTAPKPRVSSFGLGAKNEKSPVTRGILKTRSSGKSKNSQTPVAPVGLDETQILRENTRMNEEFAWRVPPDSEKPQSLDRRKRESIHSITMNIAPPPVPPPASAAEKVYGVDLELPTVKTAPTTRIRDLTILRQPKGDFGFNLRWAPYKDSSGSIRQVVHAEPGSSGALSGVITGDRIIEVNKVNVEHSTREEVIGLVQKSGETLRLRVQQIPEVSELNQQREEKTDKAIENEVSKKRL